MLCRRGNVVKKICLLVLFALLILSTSITASAHSGRTDGKGGHYDSSTGEYHYHHGYPAHQHKNGECPYDFDDNTNNNDSNSNGLYSNGLNNNSDDGNSSNISEQGEAEMWIYWLIGGLALTVLIMFFVLRARNRELSGCRGDISSYRQEISEIKNQMKTAEEQAVAPYIERVKSMKSQIASTQRQLEEANALLAKKEQIIQTMLSAPSRTLFAEDGLPIFW